MYHLSLVTTTDDPHLDIIAECFINNQYIYFWKDSVWATGTTALEEQAGRPAPLDENKRNKMWQAEIIIYPIGVTPDWMQEDNLD
jgi:hypothetical protein